MNNERKTIDILGITIDDVTLQQSVERFKEIIEREDGQDGLSLIVTPNPEIILAAQKDERIVRTLNGAALAIPDGVSIVKASAMLGTPVKERVTGIDFTFEALRYLASAGRSAYFLGAKPGIAEAAAKNVCEKIPRLVVAGTHDGYFKPEEEAGIVADINASGADFLCLALGSPKQEFFADDHRGELKVKAAIGVGGSFDVWSGTLKRAPGIFRKLGVEWLYRLMQEPSRLGRMSKIPQFFALVRKAAREG